jgi:hypothetical protein
MKTSEKEVVTKIFETLLCTPGMNDNVKIELKLSRRNILLLTSVIERGLSEDNEQLPVVLSEKVQEEISAIPAELLQKAGLTEMSEKLKSL